MRQATRRYSVTDAMYHDDNYPTSRNWLFRCSRCDHSYRATAKNQALAKSVARTNGWIVDESPLCPGCASIVMAPSPTRASVENDAA